MLNRNPLLAKKNSSFQNELLWKIITESHILSQQENQNFQKSLQNYE